MEHLESKAADTPVSVQDKPKSSKKKKKRTAKYYLTELLIKMGFTVAVLCILLNFIVAVNVCHDNSAYPMIKDGDFCLTYRLAEIRQGDPVSYRDGDKIRFARVIAFGGDTVDIQNDAVEVNGIHIAENVVYPTAKGNGIAFPYTIPDDCVFVLNDYRSDLSDSRELGGIRLSDIQGAVVFIMRRRGI